MTDAVRVRVGQSNAIRITQSDRVNAFRRLDDVDLVTNGQHDGSVLVYNDTTQKWTSTQLLTGSSEYNLTIDGGSF
jgi:hypothetical protein